MRSSATACTVHANTHTHTTSSTNVIFSFHRRRFRQFTNKSMTIFHFSVGASACAWRAPGICLAASSRSSTSTNVHRFLSDRMGSNTFIYSHIGPAYRSITPKQPNSIAFATMGRTEEWPINREVKWIIIIMRCVNDLRIISLTKWTAIAKIDR